MNCHMTDATWVAIRDEWFESDDDLAGTDWDSYKLSCGFSVAQCTQFGYNITIHNEAQFTLLMMRIGQ